MILRKTHAISNLKLLDEAQGLVQAYVNSMGVVDADGDRLLAGAFQNATRALAEHPVTVLWGHDPSKTIGKMIDAVEVGRADGSTGLLATMQLNLATQRGQEAFSDIRFGSLTEWSVGFNVEPSAISVTREEGGKSIQNIAAVDLVEVSAVVRGASPDTATVAVKGDAATAQRAKGAIPPHDTPTTGWETPWDGPAAIAALPDDDRDAYRRMFAYVAEGANPDAKSSYKFPHHEFARAETTGAANVKACISGVAVLNGGMGGADIPAAARSGIYRHLADHLRDADREPPELKSAWHKESLGGDVFTTVDEARARADQLGCEGVHEMGENYMPCASHAEYERLTEAPPPEPISTYSADNSHPATDPQHNAAAMHTAAASVLRARLRLLQSESNQNDREDLE
jgi:HK97 family phage prohead protease